MSVPSPASVPVPLTVSAVTLFEPTENVAPEDTSIVEYFLSVGTSGSRSGPSFALRSSCAVGRTPFQMRTSS